MASTDLPHGWTWEGVLARLEEHADLEQTARSHGAIVRLRVIKSAGQLLRLVLAYVLSGLSLRGTVAWAEAAGEASFSDVALLKRLKSCAPWLRDLVGVLSVAANSQEGVVADERPLMAVDATTICSPGGKMKPYRVLHTVYDVGAQCFRTTLVTERTVAERLDIGEVKEGEIRLGDRVYGRYRDLAAVQTAGADYVVRLSTNSLKLRNFDGSRFDRIALCRRAEADGLQVAQVQVHDGQKIAEVLGARVIVLALPPQQAEAARRAARRKAKKWGHTLSADALVAAGCVMLITSLPADDWPAERVLALYRQRWQVELAFKRLKSLLDLERLRAFDPELVSAWIHAVLLVALIIDLERPTGKTVGPDSPRSLPGEDEPSRCGGSPPFSHAA